MIEAYRETLDASRRLLALTTAQIQALEVRPSEAKPAQLKELAEVLIERFSRSRATSEVWAAPMCGVGQKSRATRTRRVSIAS